MSVLSRRSLLKGMVGGAVVTVALPPLEIFLNTHGDALACGGSLPKRFGVFFWGNGNIPWRWNPSTTGPNWEPSEQLLPLVPMREKITIVSGMRVNVGNIIPHLSGSAGILTGHPAIGDDKDWTFGAPTIDQLVADAIGGETRFPSLELGVYPEGSDGDLSFAASHTPNPAEDSPSRLFERLFGPTFRLPGEEPIVDPKMSLRRSVLDAVMADSDRLKKRLGAADKRRLEQHLDAVRALERRIAKLEDDPPDLAACARPNEPTSDLDLLEGRPQLMEKNLVMAELLAMALACDLTRVFHYVLTRPLSGLLFQGIEQGHHKLTHDEPGDQPQVHSIVVTLMEAYNQFLQTLDSIDEGDGTVLDRCLILGTSDVSLGREHSLDDFPIVLAGGGCGAIKMGFHYRSEASENASKVLLSLVRAMGIPAAEFGSEGGQIAEGLGAIEL